MTRDVLSQAELDTLLNSKSNTLPQSDGTLLGHEQRARRSQSSAASIACPPIQPHDFRRPRQFGKEQLRALESVQQRFARNLSIALSTLLRAGVVVDLASIDQVTFDEFLQGLENPTCLSVLRAAPLEDQPILDVSYSILYPMIDRLLGGGSSGATVVRRPPTEIELRLASRISVAILAQLAKAWQPAVELHLSVERVENDPRLMQIAQPRDCVTSIAFTIALHEARGTMRFCCASRSLAEHIRRLEEIAGGSGTGPVSHDARNQAGNQIGANLQNAVVEVVAHLAETKITTSDMLNLRVGDIIATEKDMHSPVAVSLEGTPKFRAHLGAFKGRKAIQIAAPSDPADHEGPSS